MKSVTDFAGAYPEQPGVDSSEAFLRALDSKQAVSVPDARFWVKRPLIFDHGSALVGEGLGPYDHVGPAPWEAKLGPTLLITHDQGEGALVGEGVNGGVDGLTIAYPDQVRPNDPGVGTTGPRKYPPTIVAKQPFRVTRCTLPNSYDAIRALVGRTYVHDCHIGAYHRGVFADNAWDVVRVARTIIEPFWDWGLKVPPFQGVDYWVLNNGVGIEARKADGLQINDVLIFGQYAGILFGLSTIVPDGAVSGQGTNVNIDTCRHGVISRGTEERVGFIFNNLILGPYWADPPNDPRGHAVWIQRGEASAPSRIVINGGSTRKDWATRDDGSDWALRVDDPASQLVCRNVLGLDLRPRL